jgi:hypothetical protein
MLSRIRCRQGEIAAPGNFGTACLRSGEEIMHGERPPGHAGPLAGWERIAIVALLAIMVGLIVLLTISAAPARGDHAGDRPPLARPRLIDQFRPAR